MAFQGDSIYWVEVHKIVPNPFQPRREFDDSKLKELAESIRMYGVLQPLTVTRKEVQREDGTFYTEYELIAGERRLRASKVAGVAQVPVIIRDGEDSEQEKLELAIIENLQREDLNAIDRALAFKQLADQFNLSHTQVAQKVGRSREYVSNSIRLLALPEHMQQALQRGELSEGHARTLLMLSDRPEEQEVIFKEILLKKMSVRESERIIRKIATDKVRKKTSGEFDDRLIEIEKQFTEILGTRVQILKTDFGGKLTIDYFSDEDLTSLLARVAEDRAKEQQEPRDEMAVHSQTHEMSDAAPTALANEVLSQATPLAMVEQELVETTESTDEEGGDRNTLTEASDHEIFDHHDVIDHHNDVDEDQEPSAAHVSADGGEDARMGSSEAEPAASNRPETDFVPPRRDQHAFSSATNHAAQVSEDEQSLSGQVPQSQQTPQSQPAQKDLDEDLYSIRHFSL